MKQVKRSLMLCCAASAVTLPALAHAQGQGAAPTTPSQTQTESQGAVVTSDIIVTATRDARNLVDVPMSVNVATGEQLENSNCSTPRTYSNWLPALS